MHRFTVYDEGGNIRHIVDGSRVFHGLKILALFKKTNLQDLFHTEYWFLDDGRILQFVDPAEPGEATRIIEPSQVMESLDS